MRKYEPILEHFPGWEELRKKIVFIGGSLKYASVQVRCCQIASWLGCEYYTDIESIPKLSQKKILVFIKPSIPIEKVEELSQYYLIFWDLHDFLPPKSDCIKNVICSTDYSTKYLSGNYNSYVIPHHHCNFDRIKKKSNQSKNINWFGRRHWMTNSNQNIVRFVDSYKLTTKELIEEISTTYIGYCFRANKTDTQEHININPGIKAINFMGFGIPAIVPPEPAYVELCSEGVIICEEDQSAKHLEKLISDESYYKFWENRAYLTGEKFHISNIIIQYASLFIKFL